MATITMMLPAVSPLLLGEDGANQEASLVPGASSVPGRKKRSFSGPSAGMQAGKDSSACFQVSSKALNCAQHRLVPNE